MIWRGKEVEWTGRVGIKKEKRKKKEMLAVGEACMVPPGVKGRIFDRFGLSTEGTLIFIISASSIPGTGEREGGGELCKCSCSLCVSECLFMCTCLHVNASVCVCA